MMRADFTSQAYFRNPTAEIEKLRFAGPVVEVQFPMIGKIWTTTTQELADRVLKDSETFTIRSSAGSVAGLQWWMPRILGTLANHMLSKDEPDHRRLRDIVDEAFRRRAVVEMEPRILALADRECGAAPGRMKKVKSNRSTSIRSTSFRFRQERSGVSRMSDQPPLEKTLSSCSSSAATLQRPSSPTGQ
jgi:cytochrome P450